MRILVLNGGSSSLKGLLCDVSDSALPAKRSKPLWDARVDWGRRPGQADIRISSDGRSDERQIGIDSPRAVLEPVLGTIEDRNRIDAVGHRIVHGGKAFREMARITAGVKAEIAKLAQYAPEHNRLELEAIEAAEQVLGPRVPQIAVFDTAFHTTLPLAAQVYPGPYEWLDEGIRRYGFHGISHQYTSRRAAEVLGRDLKSLRLITCHLGNGCSLAAVRFGESVDTTMGFTPLEGLMMGTRSGTVDPGILIHLVRNRGMAADQLDHVLNSESGLKGISGVSADMRDIMAAIAKGNERAKLAFDIFNHRLCREIGGMLASLGGMDALVFTAGIGENSPEVRDAVCARLRFFGVALDPDKNRGARGDQDIAAENSRVRVLVIHTDEDWEIVRECYRMASRGAGRS